MEGRGREATPSPEPGIKKAGTCRNVTSLKIHAIYYGLFNVCILP